MTANAPPRIHLLPASFAADRLQKAELTIGGTPLSLLA